MSDQVDGTVAALDTAASPGDHASQPIVVDNGGCTRELFSKWYYRILRFGSLGVTMALVICSMIGFSSLTTDVLGLGAQGLLFQFVFALIGFIWGVLLFAAEFAYMKFRKYFGFLRKRLGRAIMHLIIGFLCVLFGNQNSSVVVIFVLGCFMLTLSALHFGVLIPCLVIHEIQSDDPAAMTREEYHEQMRAISVV